MMTFGSKSLHLSSKEFHNFTPDIQNFADKKLWMRIDKSLLEDFIDEIIKRSQDKDVREIFSLYRYFDRYTKLANSTTLKRIFGADVVSELADNVPLTLRFNLN